MRPCGRGVRRPEALGQQPARLGEVGGRQALELVDGERQVDRPLRRVADQGGGLDAQRIGELAQHQQRGIAGAALQLGQVALGDARRLGQRLARHAPPRAGQPHALADALEVGLVGRRRAAPRLRAGRLGWWPCVPCDPRRASGKDAPYYIRWRPGRQNRALQRRPTCSMMQRAAGDVRRARRPVRNDCQGRERDGRLGGAMSYPRIYNAAADMVDRNVTHGRGAKPAFIDPGETLTYGELQARCNRMANLLATYGICRASRASRCCCSTRSISPSPSGAPSRPASCRCASTRC